MTEGDPRRSFAEQFTVLQAAQEALARRGYYLHPVEKEHCEGLITGPLVHRLRTQIRKRGFQKVAAHTAISFSGYAYDEREIFAIPEVRAYWRQLDHELPELPALLAIIPELEFNGPGQHLMLVGEVDEVIHRPARFGYDLHVVGAEMIIGNAIQRIHQAGRRYHLDQTAVSNLADHFTRGAHFRL